MANEAASKLPPNPNENTTVSNATDQQKVPPLRIVLNSSGNQKSSSATTVTNTTTTTTGAQQTNPKKEASKDAKTEGSVKVGGRVRIKLGTAKQQSSGKSSNNNKSNETKRTNGATSTNERLIENINEDSASSFGHLRRITRRSQRAVQSISNEDEESISSMTSTDENQSANNNQATSDNTATQESDQPNSANLTSNTAGSSAANGSSNTETPRRYKRRKVETSESQTIDCDVLLGSQNYRLPMHNSFQLFKNIRNQVDKRLKNLNNVSPRIPHGFRDYMLTRGAYLLDGNKLGNGTNLFMNEDGGLNSAPLGKYRVLRYDRTSYSVPNRAKVPLGLPINSPLYDLFIEQEKERYRMRMQHIKEREKLTLAAEQEIMRAYHQAALAAADQNEPFSACTMLKHQEIYNYMDSNGVTILSREDAQQDQVQPDGVRTRRRQHGQISPSPPSRKTSDVEESAPAEVARKRSESTNAPTEKIETDTQQSTGSEDKSASNSKDSSNQEPDATTKECQPEASSCKSEDAKESESDKDTSGICPITPPDSSDKSKSDGAEGKPPVDPSQVETSEDGPGKSSMKTEAISPVPATDLSDDQKSSDAPSRSLEQANDQGSSETSNGASIAEGDTKSSAEMQIVTEAEETNNSQLPTDVGSSVSNEDKRIQNKELFLSKLQEVDDKWEKIRHDMHVRHKNEAESLHAIQKLEWEWKTKEIGACDVRTTPIIDNTLVPKLNIYSQDY